MNNIIQDDVANVLAVSLPWENINNKTILVTGGAGFLASYIIETLLRLPIIDVYPRKVICLVRNIAKAHQRFTHHQLNSTLTFLQGDVCDITDIEGDVDIIIHAASLASPKYYGIDPVGIINANVIGTRNMLNLAKKKKCTHFLFLSSGEIYGQFDISHQSTKESDMGYLDCMQVRACYAESKRMGENMCVAYHHQYGVNTIIVRPFHTYGPGMDITDGRVFSDFVSNILNKNDIVLKSDGSSRRPFCYVSDATIGFFTALLLGDKGEAYNIGNPKQELSVRELAMLLINEFSELNIGVIYSEREKSDSYIASPVIRNTPDIQKISKLGWNPNVNAANGFRRTVTSFELMGKEDVI
jgi:Nucleoside-diphosphate-sugar epimerases